MCFVLTVAIGIQRWGWHGTPKRNAANMKRPYGINLTILTRQVLKNFTVDYIILESYSKFFDGSLAKKHSFDSLSNIGLSPVIKEVSLSKKKFSLPGFSFYSPRMPLYQ